MSRFAFGIILAAGRGRRLGEGAPPEGKAFTPILGESMLRWSVRALDACPEVDAIVIVAPPGEESRAREAAAGCDGKLAGVVAGGEERQDSLGAGLDALAALGKGDPLVAVHDAARALVRPEDVGRAVTAAERWGAAILAVPVKDTIKLVEKESWIRGTPDRATLWIAQTPQAARALVRPVDVSRAVVAAERWGAAILAVPVKDTIKVVEKESWIQATPDRATLWIAQTPQVARASLLRRGLMNARARALRSTDEAALLEGIGVAVRVVLGDYGNLKITTPDDVAVAEAILRKRSAGAPDGAGL